MLRGKVVGGIVIISLLILSLFVKETKGKEKGLVAHWSFDEGEGSLIKDKSGNGIEGKIYGAEWVKMPAYTALKFNGKDNYIQTVPTDLLKGTDKISAEVYFFAGDLGRYSLSGYRNIRVPYQCVVCLEKGFSIEMGEGMVWVYLWSTAYEREEWWEWTIGKCPTGWTQAAFTYDGKLLRLYLNGVEVRHSDAYRGPLPQLSSPTCFWIGGLGRDKENFRGLIKEIKVYKRVLTSEEINKNYRYLKEHSGSEKSLVGCWSFDEGEGAIVKDSSLYANDGKVYSGKEEKATWVKGITGSALSFDGADDYVEVRSDMFKQLKTFTVEAWVYNLADYYQDIVRNGGGVPIFVLDAGAQKSRFAVVYPANKSAIATADITLSTDSWHHIAATFDEKSLKGYLYVDGQKQNQEINLPESPQDCNGVINIGTDPWKNYPAKGKIDEVRIYNYALSAEEIAKHYKDIRGKEFLSPPSVSTYIGAKENFQITKGTKN